MDECPLITMTGQRAIAVTLPSFYYLLAMGVEDIRGKLQKIAKLEIMRVLLFGSKRL